MNKETFRVSLLTTPKDWQDFRELAKSYGWTVSSLFTKMFDDGLQFMKDNKPQIDIMKVNFYYDKDSR